MSRLRHAIALSLACVAAAAQADPCPIPTHDPTTALRKSAGSLHIVTTNRTDADSREPIVRTIIDYDDGSTIIVEQQNCQMENLRIALMSPGVAPSDRELRRAGKVLATMPIWQRNFPGRKADSVLIDEVRSAQFDAAKAAGAFSYGVEKRLDAQRATSEAIVSFTAIDSPASPYKSQLSLYLGIGGQ